MRFWYELMEEHKSRRRYIEKKTRLDTIDDFINRLGHRSVTILLEVLVFMKKRTQQNGVAIVTVATIFLVGFFLGSGQLVVVPWLIIVSIVITVLIVMSPPKEDE